ncbi:hypothetical protein [Streptomyces wuyuanensis]|uniref:hypothetical protein n=1 Tax=Streptomyces wuyuanensis TaxID=1196353 RepID=UPI003435EA77
MSAPTPASRAPRNAGLQPPAFGRPSPALIARADRGYSRFVADPAPATDTGDHHQDDDAAGAR